MSQSYNGWSNYATWRVNLEIFDGLSPLEITGRALPAVSELREILQEMAEQHIKDTSSEGLARDYAMAFLAEVNYWEIANQMLVDYAGNDEYADDCDDTYDEYGVNTKNSFNTPPKA